jgi:tripartite-type tricarboxylate transporter receptor subunit TctC
MMKRGAGGSIVAVGGMASLTAQPERAHVIASKSGRLLRRGWASPGSSTIEAARADRSLPRYIKSGRLRAIAVTSAEPSVLAPGLRTVASSGLPGYESILIYGVFAPARMPDAITPQLNQAIVDVLRTPEVRQRFLNVGVETVGSTPEQFAATIAADVARLRKVIKEAGIRQE